jgi:hypothetical protein
MFVGEGRSTGVSNQGYSYHLQFFLEERDLAFSEVLLPSCTVFNTEGHNKFSRAPLWKSQMIHEECYSEVRLDRLAVHWIANCVKWTHNGDVCCVCHCEMLTVSHKSDSIFKSLALLSAFIFTLLGHWVVLEKLIVAMLDKFPTCSEPGDSVLCYQESATGYYSEPDEFTPQSQTMLFSWPILILLFRLHCAIAVNLW